MCFLTQPSTYDSSFIQPSPLSCIPELAYPPPTYNPNPNLIIDVQPQTIPTISPELEVQSTSTSYNTLNLSSHMLVIPFFHKPHILLGKLKQLVDVTQADDGDIQNKSIVEELAKCSHLMVGISKEKSLRTHHQ